MVFRAIVFSSRLFQEPLKLTVKKLTELPPQLGITVTVSRIDQSKWETEKNFMIFHHDNYYFLERGILDFGYN